MRAAEELYEEPHVIGDEVPGSSHLDREEVGSGQAFPVCRRDGFSKESLCFSGDLDESEFSGGCG